MHNFNYSLFSSQCWINNGSQMDIYYGGLFIFSNGIWIVITEKSCLYELHANWLFKENDP